MPAPKSEGERHARLMGGKPGALFARAGHGLPSTARNDDKLKKLARETQGNARADTPREAAREAGAALLAVRGPRMDDVLRQAGDLSGRRIVTCSLPMNDDNAGLVRAHTSSGTEALAQRVPEAEGVAAFHSAPGEVLFSMFEARGNATQRHLVCFGDTQPEERPAARLIRDVGFESVDAGPLRSDRYLEPFALLVDRLAYWAKGAQNPRTGSSGFGHRMPHRGIKRRNSENGHHT
jgi:8-hydroxy-5-deazaflavin:NADPH oxidoreductase